MSVPTATKKRTRNSKKAREAEATKEYESYIDSNVSDGLIRDQKDDDLFVVDRGGSKNKRRKLQKEDSLRKESGTSSKTEKVLIDRLKSKKGKTLNQKTKKTNKSDAFDLWGGEEEEKQVSRPTNRKSIKKIAGPGMSYNPAHDDHQEALAEVLYIIFLIYIVSSLNYFINMKAVALDMKHQENIVRNEKSMELVADVTVNQDGSESDESSEGDSSGDEEYERDDTTSGPRRLSRRERARRENVKLTRAQRNKLRTKRISGYEKSLADQQKALEKELSLLPKHIKKLEDDEAKKQAKKEFREAQKLARIEAEEIAKTSMTYEDAGTVPLTDELRGSLRQMQPKGIALNDQSALMTATGDLMSRDRRTRRKSEKPHAGKKVKWIPKYKHF